jgi:hypothetical protein
MKNLATETTQIPNLGEIHQRYSYSLEKLTGQKTGLFIDEDGDCIICNWSYIEGIPRIDLTGYNICGSDEAMTLICKEDMPDILAELIQSESNEDLNIIFDPDPCFNFNTITGPGTKYLIKTEHGRFITIITPHIWR